MMFMRLTPILRKLQVPRKSRLKKFLVYVKTPLKKFLVYVKTPLKKLLILDILKQTQGRDYIAAAKNRKNTVGLEEYTES